MRRYNHIIICIIGVATILAMAGCERSDFIDSQSETEQIITFSSTVEASRAVETFIGGLQEDGFKIATFLTNDDKTLYYNDIVKYSSDSGWASDYTRYWPVAYELNMFAYSPFEFDEEVAKELDFEDYVTIENGEDYDNYSLRYNCPANIYDQIDMLAVTLEDQSYDEDGVELAFQHILSSLKFNVEIKDESNITLNTISLNYMNIERERSYNFATEAWEEESEEIYFDIDSGCSTTLTVDESKTFSSGSVVFDEIDEQLMIIPQTVTPTSTDDPHYISIQITYTLNSADGTAVAVNTGVMPLPAPVDSDPDAVSNMYSMGKLYTYNLIVNGETISFGDISIADQEGSEQAYGNIDLGLITTTMSAADLNYSQTVTEADPDQYYYTTALRVQRLLNDGVRDFVVIGSLGADSSSVVATNDDSSQSGESTSDYDYLGNGKLGYYGSTSSPFHIGTVLAGLSADDHFSVDLRGTYDYPEFQYANGDDGAAASSDINLDDPILTSGLFASVKNIREVILPQDIMAIGSHAFEDCDALESIDIANAKHIELGAFQHSSSLAVVENGALTRIHENGFDSCESLVSIDLSAVTQIDEYGFVDCSKLTDVDLSNLKVIGMHAFDGCNALTLKEGSKIQGFTSVADYAFSECYELCANGIEIDIVNATSVGDHAFNECQHILLSGDDDSVDNDSRVLTLGKLTFIGNNAFTNCIYVGDGYEVSLPVIETIGTSAFNGCKCLNIIEGLDRLTTIELAAFQGCTDLTGYSSSITDESEKILSLPLVTTVNSFGFCGSGVTNIAFSKEYLREIGTSAFDGCIWLTTLSGLESVTTVGNYAFSSCNELESLELPSLEDDGCGGDFFYGCTSLKTLSLPLITNNDLGWTDSAGNSYPSTIMGMISNSCGSELEELDIPLLEVDTLSTIGSQVNLKVVNLASVTYVKDSPFSSCTQLEELILSKAEGSIGGWGHFGGSKTLKYVDLASVTELGAFSFQYFTSLEAIDLSSVRLLGSMALQGCTALKRLNLSSIPKDTDDTDTIGDWAFANMYTDTPQCDIWLSDDQRDSVSDDNTNTWQGVKWKNIYFTGDKDVADSGYVEFTLKEEDAD